MTSTKSLIIVQPYVPKYRVSFFERLNTELAHHGISCKVVASEPDRLQGARGDAARPDWVQPVTQRSITLAGMSIGLGGARPEWRNADGVIVGLLGSSADTYLALMDGLRGRIKVGVWGHVKPYVSPGNRLDLALERWQMRVADHIFAYTPGGADYAKAAGVDTKKITTVMNSVDTRALHAARASVSDVEVAEFMDRHGLTPSRTLAFIGGLDESKRIDFLASALDALWKSAPDIKLLVGGQGAQSAVLERAFLRKQCIQLGYVDPHRKAVISKVASGLVMPGRIGLVAVDALVLSLPVLTTDWPFHAPEAEYLVEGQSRFSSADDIQSYANLIIDFLDTASRLPSRCEHAYPTIDGMVENYVSGVLQMLGTNSQRRASKS